MPIDPQFPNDIFLSYASEDVAWARRLDGDLSSRGLVVYRDEKRLTAGPQWATQLQSDLHASRQLVVLHSEAARDSDWVRKEVEYFNVLRYNARLPAGVREPIAVMLEGEWAPFDPYQFVGLVRAQNAYAGGADNFADHLWLKVVDAVDAGVRVADPRQRVTVLVLTTTQERLRALVEGSTSQAVALNDLAARLGISGEALLQRYGETRSMWKPFGDETIRVLLDELQNEINDRLEDSPGVRWDFPEESSFWEVTADEARKRVRRLERDACLIVLDPLAFFDDQVEKRFTNVLGGPLRNPGCYLLVLAPVSAPPIVMLRDQVKELAWRAYEHFYEPPLVRDARFAAAAPHVADRLDLQGWLMTALRPVLWPPRTTEGSWATKVR
jgi:hypothetical protein